MATTPPDFPPVTTLSEDEYDERFEPLEAPDGSTTWEYDELGDLPYEHVWSVVETGDADHDALYAIPGYHVVNMVGYNVCAHPRSEEDENVEVLLHEFEHEEDEDDFELRPTGPRGCPDCGAPPNSYHAGICEEE